MLWMVCMVVQVGREDDVDERVEESSRTLSGARSSIHPWSRWCLMSILGDMECHSLVGGRGPRDSSNPSQ